MSNALEIVYFESLKYEKENIIEDKCHKFRKSEEKKGGRIK